MPLKATIVRQFGKPAGLLGALAGHIMARRSSNRLRNRRTVDLMQLGSAAHVLEVGCGPGLALARCAGIVRDGHVTGVDHSAVMISQARRRLVKAGLDGRTELIVSGTDKLNEWVSQFDRVYSLNVIQFIRDRHTFLHAVHRSLKPGGKVFTTYQPRLSNDAVAAAKRMADEVKQAMTAAGFTGIVQHDLTQNEAPAFCLEGSKI